MRTSGGSIKAITSCKGSVSSRVDFPTPSIQLSFQLCCEHAHMPTERFALFSSRMNSHIFTHAHARTRALACTTVSPCWSVSERRRCRLQLDTFFIRLKTIYSVLNPANPQRIPTIWNSYPHFEYSHTDQYRIFHDYEPSFFFFFFSFFLRGKPHVNIEMGLTFQMF